MPILSHPQLFLSEKVFPDFQREPPVFQFILLPFFLSLGITGKNLGPSSLQNFLSGIYIH